MLEELQLKEAIQESLKSITKSAIDKVGCTDEKIVGDIHLNGVTNENFLRLLGVVEQRSLEICKLLSGNECHSSPPYELASMPACTTLHIRAFSRIL